MTTHTPLVLDHVLNPAHDALTHSAVFTGSEGNLFCVHCASERYESAPNFRRLALLGGINSIVRAHRPPSLRGGIGACLSMLLHGIDSTETSMVQTATDVMLALQGELPDPMAVLASLVSRIVSFGLPRASGHLYLVGQLLTNASHDRALAATLGNACIARDDEAPTGCEGGLVGGADLRRFHGFGSFLAAHTVSVSCPDHIKSDVLYVAMELLDCCTAARVDPNVASQDPVHAHYMNTHPSLPPPADDPFVCMMLAIPRLLARRSSCDEPLQLHSVAYLATAAVYCRQRTEAEVPGWSTSAAGVPEVLVTLFDGVSNGDRDFARSEVVLGSDGAHPSSDGLCGTIKALLMSSSYRVRTATARLIASLCMDSSASAECAYEGTTSDTKRGGCFFRETLIATGATDFLFEAIKSEREGTPRHYLEALGALACSPVEFFHTDNFPMKFAASVLMGAFRGQPLGGSDSSTYREDTFFRTGFSHEDEDDEANVSALSSRLLLEALIAVPPSSLGGIVEELLATAAASTRTDATSKIRSIGVAADVLNLIASGEISVSKDRGNFIDAVEVLLDHLEEDLICAARSKYQEQECQTSAVGAASSMGSANRSTIAWPPGQDCSAEGGFIIQAARIMESLLRMSEEWVVSQEYLNSSSQAPRRFGNDVAGGSGTREESFALANLVFGAYERTLAYQHDLVARSKTLTQGVAFLSCMGAAVDATSAVLHRQWEEIASDKGGIASLRLLQMRPSFIGVGVPDLVQEDHGSIPAPADDGADDTTDPATAVPASCLETILTTTVEADVTAWVLDLYERCGGAIAASADVNHRRGRSGVREAEAGAAFSQSSEGSDGDITCYTTTRELLVDILQSLLDAQGWINGLCSYGSDYPSRVGQSAISGVGDGMSGNGMCEALDSTFGETVRLVLKSWTLSDESGGETMPLDQYVMSLLGTYMDNGDLCKLAVLLMSLSPSFLGILHPHPGCRVDSAVTLLQYVKSLPEAVFCLNLFSYAVFTCGNSEEGCGVRPSRLSGSLSAAVGNVLARFPVEDFALSLIPLSATTLSLALRADRLAFVADWLIATPLGRVSQVLDELGAFRGLQHDEDVTDLPRVGEERARFAEQGQRCATISIDDRDEEALTGVLKSVVSRWGVQLEESLQHDRAEATILRLSRVLLMSPDIFFYLAFGSGSYRHDYSGSPYPERQEATPTVADALGVIIPETLERLATALSQVLLRDTESGNGDWTFILDCMSQVSQLASAFLRARCARGFYTPGGRNASHVTARLASSGRPPPEVGLARACGSCLSQILGPRRGQGRGGRDGMHVDVRASLAILSMLNLLNALLVLVSGDSDLLHDANEELAFALQEARESLSDVLISTPMAAERLTGWLDHAPQIFAAFLQACGIFNAFNSTTNSTNSDGTLDRKYLIPPFQIIERVLSSGSTGLYTNNNTRPPEKGALVTRGVRRSLLLVLGARCVEGAASKRPFSRQEVLALQLSLQGIACEGDSTLASAACGAIQALWEAYVGVLPLEDLVGQSWNPFVVECCLENALGLLAGHGNIANIDKPHPGDGALRSNADLRLGESPESALVLISSIGRLLRLSVGKKCPRLRTFMAAEGCNVGILSAMALVHVHECTDLLATNLYTTLEAGSSGGITGVDPIDLGEERGQAQLHGGNRCEGLASGVTINRLDALAQLVHLLVCIGTQPQGSTTSGASRQGLVDTLSRLQAALLTFCEGQSRGRASGSPQQVSMPLSSGAYYDLGDAGALGYDGVFFVKSDNWRALSSTSGSLSWAELAVEVKRLLNNLKVV